MRFAGGGWLLRSTECSTPQGTVKVSPISWRSAQIKRKVSSTLAGGNLAPSQAVAEVEWMQVMLGEIMVGDEAVRDKPVRCRRSIGPTGLSVSKPHRRREVFL